MKIEKKKIFFLGGGVGWGGGSGSGWGGGGQGGCERRTEVFVKIQNFFFGGGGLGGGVRVDVNQELKFFGKFKKKKLGGEGWVHGGSGGWGGGGGWVRLGGQDGCERRIEVFVKIKKKLFFFWGGGGGRVGGGGGRERRIEVFVKIQQKKNFFFGGGGRVGRRGGLGEGSG